MYQVNLQWKNYPVKLDRMHKHLKDVCNNYDGMVASEEKLIVILTYENQADIILINEYWGDLTEESENTLESQEILELYKEIIEGAMKFSNRLIVEFAAENILMGITQAGKTKSVADFLQEVIRYMQTGSLYEALNSIDAILQAQIPSEISPFITEERLNKFKLKIQEYLGG